MLKYPPFWKCPSICIPFMYIISHIWNNFPASDCLKLAFKTLTILRGITIIRATSERLITFSNIPRSEYAPAYVLCLHKSYYTSGILLWLPMVSNMHPQYIKDNMVIKTKWMKKDYTIHRGTSWERGHPQNGIVRSQASPILKMLPPASICIPLI